MTANDDRDPLIEACAAAIYACDPDTDMFGQVRAFGRISGGDYYRRLAEAVLRVARPVILEEATREAMTTDRDDLANTLYRIGGGKSWGYDLDDANRDADQIIALLRARWSSPEAVVRARRAWDKSDATEEQDRWAMEAALRAAMGGGA